MEAISVVKAWSPCIEARTASRKRNLMTRLFPEIWISFMGMRFVAGEVIQPGCQISGKLRVRGIGIACGVPQAAGGFPALTTVFKAFFNRAGMDRTIIPPIKLRP
jgi:hypothetical protein